MESVYQAIEVHKARVALHPLYAWLKDPTVPLENRFDFAPCFATFIMAFSDLNKWFLRYTEPQSELEMAMNHHTFEDQTHSRLFLEDWKKLRLDPRLGWKSSDTLAWYYAAPQTEVFRSFGMEIMRTAVQASTPLVRYALMEAIEACGHVFFSETAPIAEALQQVTGVEYRYFGRYHLARETGHVLAGEAWVREQRLSLAEREEALRIVDRIFEMFLTENDHLLAFARSGLELPTSRQTGQALPAQGRPAPRLAKMEPTESHQTVAHLLERRLRATERHPLFGWLDSKEMSAEETLRRLLPLWIPDMMGYRDLAKYALAYANPKSAEERAINRWTSALERHYQLFLDDWRALGMDDVLGWDAGQTLQHCCLSRFTELQRKNFATFVRLAAMFPEPASRFWLITALEATGEPFFQHTRALALDVEKSLGAPLHYLAGRHDLVHTPLPVDVEAAAVDFFAAPLPAHLVEPALLTVSSVFDGIESQYTMTLETLLPKAQPAWAIACGALQP